MFTTRVSAEAVLDAPAELVYHCIADYQHHHRPGGFLPDAFKEMYVEGSRVGTGTRITFRSVIGGISRVTRQDVSEPRPGRVLVEAGDGSSTTFTVAIVDDAHCRVRFDTVLEAPGVQGMVTRVAAPHLLRPVYRDELRRLERTAREHMSCRG